MSPLPTPYDILSIPYFAYEPSTKSIVILILCLSLIYFCFILVKKRVFFKRINVDLYKTTIDKMNALLSDSDLSISRDWLRHISSTTKLYLNHFIDVNIESASGEELDQLIDKNRDNSILVNCLLQIKFLDSLTYSPNPEYHNCYQIICELKLNLERLHCLKGRADQ